MYRCLIFISVLLLMAGCRDNRRLNAALDFAGENRVELERVLEHYRDSGLKYEAARFLIENMPGYYGYAGSMADSGRAVLLSMTGSGQIGAIDPERVERWQWQSCGLKKVYDARVITADYLIDNIDRAFEAWRGRSWNKTLPFDEFCECILPYRVEHEPLEYWREMYRERYAYLLDSVYRGTDVVEAAMAVQRCLEQEGFVYNWQVSLPYLGPSFLLEHRVGNCMNACALTMYIMRALGIPVVVDFYSYCSEMRKGHTWNALRDTTGRYLGMQQITGERLSRTVPGVDGRKSGKVLRRCYAYPYYKDASADYFADTLRVPMADGKTGKVYLGIFHPSHRWVVIDSTTVKGREAVFPHVEREAVYAAQVKGQSGQYLPAGHPFYFDGKEAHCYVPDTTQTDTVALWRKYPLFTWVAEYLNETRGGRFEFSNRKDFRTLEYAYTVADTPRVAYNEVVLPRQVRCRYVRYVAPADKPTDMGELMFYGGARQYKPVAWEGTRADDLVNVMDLMFDDDPLTYYCTLTKGAVLAMDFGKQVALDRFVYVPRNDDNFIRLGDTYELFYHDGQKGWVSLGRQTAKELSLIYVVPRGALLHLRCLTRGEEEQAFAMENGRQEFYSNFD